MTPIPLHSCNQDILSGRSPAKANDSSPLPVMITVLMGLSASLMALDSTPSNATGSVRGVPSAGYNMSAGGSAIAAPSAGSAEQSLVYRNIYPSRTALSSTALTATAATAGTGSFWSVTSYSLNKLSTEGWTFYPYPAVTIKVGKLEGEGSVYGFYNPFTATLEAGGQAKGKLANQVIIGLGTGSDWINFQAGNGQYRYKLNFGVIAKADLEATVNLGYKGTYGYGNQAENHQLILNATGNVYAAAELVTPNITVQQYRTRFSSGQTALTWVDLPMVNPSYGYYGNGAFFEVKVFGGLDFNLRLLNISLFDQNTWNSSGFWGKMVKFTVKGRCGGNLNLI
jgi:hypothetical protein